MKKLTALLLAVTMVIGMLAGLGANAEAHKDSINFTFGSDPGTLAPSGNAGP